MTKPDWKNLLRELLTEAIQVEDLDTDDGAVWEMTISDERMAEFDAIGVGHKSVWDSLQLHC